MSDFYEQQIGDLKDQIEELEIQCKRSAEVALHLGIKYNELIRERDENNTTTICTNRNPNGMAN